ncbi:MAG: DUF1638 domain-containing protein [Lentisphaerae bacterium]|jgi:N-methylhydantoinase A/oxoprolinase/acetone carboxylase beta subunit|nr:DUF1638 domain-containing protein [Lentisphaerota bacterium]MBT4816826.1 DUF1638 domain-containing protein [Lentisphaerota bacterium]MBT5606121.1 DUF1638 domain-containing protein [Lentisphaerota bacterium]MBT7054012.1 DUF1638 domain-containing protein [Lentisphaerota bacterium]MBT7840428.1 DUF1638 domain-containing protein [Lentisphaerota bacterium]
MPKPKVAIIACGVLEWNIRRVMERIPDTDFITRFLPARLHENPGRLRQMLREEIERLSQDPELAGIVLGFGVCGRGTIGLTATAVPLVMPRTQDCIGIYLGSHFRYMEEFSRRPGTRYVTQGWYERNNHPQTREVQSHLSARDHSLYGASFDELSSQYGPENADFICRFRDSWKENYQRAAYIRFEGEGASAAGLEASRSLAEDLGWEHEILEGDDSLLHALLSRKWSDPRILLVPVGNHTVAAPGQAVVGFTSGVDSHVEKILARYRRTEEQEPVQRSGRGLGVDTGGTFTDAVIFDFDTDTVLAQAKAPTTHDDLIVGIRMALAELPRDELAGVTRVGLSTTLATNAFVEGKGRPVALLVASPLNIDLDRFPFRFVRRLTGAMSIEGVEQTPVDELEIGRIAQEAQEAGCEALAISGFGSVVNPAHELTAARIAHETTGLAAVCGHELTTELNFVERATTAAMNAKLTPLIEELITAVRSALDELGLEEVRVMIVKGDGSQMLDRVARSLPVETLLSGPAASVVGAAKLFSNADAVVVDMGGTTLDVALLQNHSPVLSPTGARIGDFKTCVRAMGVQTIGLGGDSEIDLSGWPQVSIGPRRIIPLCRLSTDHPDLPVRLPALYTEYLTTDPNCVDLVTVSDKPSSNEQRTLALLAEGPMLLGQLARRLNRPNPAFVPWHDLETHGAIKRYGLTLTDVMHVEKRYTAFDQRTARDMLKAWSGFLDADIDDIIQAIHKEFRRLVCDTVLSVVLPDGCPWAGGDELRRWLTQHFTEPADGRPLRIRPELAVPLIAVGAPAPALFPELEEVLNQSILISDHAGVTNAVGAIAGDVMLRESATVRITPEGVFVCSWKGGGQRAVDLEEAVRLCEAAVHEHLREAASANDIPFTVPLFSAEQHDAETRDGKLFLGVTLRGELRG